MMGETRAISRAHGINITHIRLEVQELAGLFHIHPIAAFVFIQPFFTECRHGHAQVSGNTSHILLGIGGRHRLATVGAIQAISSFPDFLVSLDDHFIQPPGSFFFQPGEKTLYTLFIMTDYLPERI
jgi:hypothetical protein